MRRGLAILALLLSAAISVPAAAEAIAIVNARIHTMGAAGVIDNGKLIIGDGKIVAVGRDIAIPPDVRTIDAGGRDVTPGLLMTGASIGIVDLPSYDVLDDAATRNIFISAAYDVRYSFNPQNPFVADARADGVTAAFVTPDTSGGSAAAPRIFAGRARTMAMSGSADAEVGGAGGIAMVAGPEGASRIGGGRGAVIVQLRAILAEVRNSAPRKRSEERYGLSRADLEALLPVAQGREPLLVSVDRASDILRFIEVAKAENIKIIFVGAREAWSVARAIAEADIPVIVDPEANIPNGLDDRLSTNENAARLATAGVRISFRAVHARPGYLARSPRSVVGRLVGVAGLDRDRALAALTIDAAHTAGVSDVAGSLETGKRADVVIWDGDPLEAMSRPAMLWIAGREQSLETRAHLLGRRYLERYRSQGAIASAAETEKQGGQ